MSSGSNDEQFVSSENDELSSLPFSSNYDEDWFNNIHRPMSVKEETDFIEKLRRENLNLRLKLYFKEKEQSSVSLKKSLSITNLNRSRDEIKNESNLTEKKLKFYITSLEKKENEIILMKNHYESIIKNKDYELEMMKTEKQLESNEEIENNLIILQDLLNEKDKEIKLLNESNHILKKNLEQKSKILEQNSKQVDQNSSNNNKENEQSLNKLNSKVLALETLLNKKNAEINYLKSNCEKCKLNEKEIELLKKESTDSQKFETVKLSLEETRKELDHFKINLKNQKIIEKEKLDNFSKLLHEKETENEELKQKIAILKKNKNKNESYEISDVYKNIIFEKEQEIDLLNVYIKNNNIKNLNEHVKKLEEKLYLQEELKKNMKTDFLKKLKAKDDLVEKLNYEKQHLCNTLETYKEKKRNYEKLISKQLQKTNLLLKTAKTNFEEKQG